MSLLRKGHEGPLFHSRMIRTAGRGRDLFETKRQWIVVSGEWIVVNAAAFAARGGGATLNHGLTPTAICCRRFAALSNLSPVS